jgi:transposase
MPLSLYHRAIFQQDNAAPHTVLLTRQFLHDEGISTAQWPALSPDLKPIENVWGLMKSFIRKKEKQSISHAWNLIVTHDLCRRLFSSMSTRIHNVFVHRGVR